MSRSISSYNQQKNTTQAYHFHILTDHISPITHIKLQALKKELSVIYPCQFSIYTMQDSLFQGLPKLNNNYLTYFRLKIGTILPKEIEKCLYLDVDMLCVDDIREIFSIDLQDNICGAVVDAAYQSERIQVGRDNSKGYKLNNNTYFNAGLMFINLKKWREHNIEEKCFDFMSCYIPTWHDQDTLNAVLENHLTILPLQWNFMLGHLESYCTQIFKGEGKDYTISYTKKEYIEAAKNAKIWHYLTAIKPWHTIRYENGHTIKCARRDEWWANAVQTPIFGNELILLYIKQNEAERKHEVQNIKSDIAKLKLLRRPHKLFVEIVQKIFAKIFHRKSKSNPHA